MKSSRGRCLLVVFVGNVCLVLGLTPNAVIHHQSPTAALSCCSRHEKYEHIDNVLGMSGTIDVGHCKKNCRRNLPNLLILLQTAEANSSEEVQPQMCPHDWLCRPASIRLQRVSTYRGIREFPVVESCQCRQKPTECSREPHNVLVFPDSPYETRLDLGTCIGHCHDGGCQPVQTRSVSVAGPNGAQCYSVVERCDCVGSCYRARHVEQVYDYSVDSSKHKYDEEDEDDEEAETQEEENRPKQPVLKEVDVGVCVGSCPRQRGGHCADPFRRNSGPCGMWLYSSKEPECTPVGFSVHNYTARNGDHKHIFVINGCRCE